MKTPEILKRCQELERPLDLHLFQVYRNTDGTFVDESGAPVTTGDKIKAGAAATAIGGGGAIVGIRALKRRYGANMATDPTKAGQALVRGVGRDISTAATAVGQKVVPAVQAGGAAIAQQATGALDKIKKSGLLAKAGKALKGVRFDTRAKLIEFAAVK